MGKSRNFKNHKHNSNAKYIKSCGITQEQRALAVEAWNYADEEDKSTEWMFAYMSDASGLDYEEVVDFVINYERTPEDFK